MHRLLACLLSVVIVSSALPVSAQKPRNLAPGVLVKIPTNLDPRDSFSLPIPLPGLNAMEYQPKYISKNETLYGMSQRVVLFRDVWEYEFSLLGQVRQAKLVVPDGDSGATKLKNVWYMVYRIRDTGKTITYEQVKQNPAFDHITEDLQYNRPIPQADKFFVPQFSLEGSVINDPAQGYQKVVYHDKVSPMVLRQIQRREDPALQLLDPVTMSKTKIPPAKTESDRGVWGVAIFEDIDPRLDYISIYVSGLSNAYRLARDTNDRSRLKTLQLNFWRPGDVIAEQEDKVIFGIPLVDDPRQQALICERYDLPGPLLRGYHINRVAADRKVLVVETDAQVGLINFQSTLTPGLDQGNLPISVAQAFIDAGIPINRQAAVKTVISGKKWSFSEGEDDYIIELEPQFWEPKVRGGIRFIKSLDYMWIYR